MAENFPKPQQHKIEPIEEVSPRRLVEKTEEPGGPSSPEKVKFDQALDQANPTKTELQLRNIKLEEAEKAAPQKPSIIDIARGEKLVAQAPSMESLAQTSTQLKQGFQAPQAYLISLQDKNIEIPKEFAKDMDARIQHMDAALMDSQKLASGVEVTSAIDPSASSPTLRFLHFLTDADKRLGSIVGDINTYTAAGKKMTPEKLLAVQIKLNYVQQELEFFTNILNRAVESVKTLMNVQI